MTHDCSKEFDYPWDHRGVVIFASAPRQLGVRGLILCMGASNFSANFSFCLFELQLARTQSALEWMMQRQTLHLPYVIEEGGLADLIN